jgi:hypothetical protein
MKSVLAAAAVLAACATPAGAQLRFEDVSATHLPAPAEGTQYASMDAVAADLDNDGDWDLVTPQEWRANRVLINDGSGRFTLADLPQPPEAELVRPPHIQQPLQKDSEDVSIADFTGDGVLDMIIAVEDDIRLGRSNVHQYFRGLGASRFERVYGQLPDTVANAVAHADITGDGAPDVILSGDAQDHLLINDGRGNFRDETAERLPREAELAQDVEFFDADGDEDLDIVLGLEGGHALWINDGQGRFSNESRERLPAPGNVEARKVTPADIDRDGDLDLYFSHVDWQGRAPQDRLYINDGRGHFTDGTADRIPTESDLTLDSEFADVDGDNDLDLVQGNGGYVKVFRNDGAGRFTEITNEVFAAPIAGGSISVEIADFNRDGRVDIYIGQLSVGEGPPAQDRLLLNRRR